MLWVRVATVGVRVPLARTRVQAVAEAVLHFERIRDAEVSVTFVSERRIASLNAKHLGHNGPTDVISFGFRPAMTNAPTTGDIYIAPAVARRNALEHGATLRDELLRLVIHGVLHIVGYDHPAGDARYASPMWKTQERHLKRALAAT